MNRRRTNRSKEAQQAIDDFKREHIGFGKRCWICGVRQASHAHHMVYRRGDEYDDQKNLCATCDLVCHPRLHGQTIVIRGVRFEGWEKQQAFAIACAAKREHDPDNYDPEFLDRLAHVEREIREHYQERK